MQKLLGLYFGLSLYFGLGLYFGLRHVSMDRWCWKCPSVHHIGGCRCTCPPCHRQYASPSYKVTAQAGLATASLPSHTHVPPSPVLSKPLEVLPASLREQRLGQGPASPTAAAVGEWEEPWLSLSRNCTPSSCRSSLCWVMSDCSWAIWVAFASWTAIPGLLMEKRAGQAGVLYWPDLAHWLAINIEVSECSSCSDQRVLWSRILSLAAAGDRCVRKATRTGKGIAMHSW